MPLPSKVMTEKEIEKLVADKLTDFGINRSAKLDKEQDLRPLRKELRKAADKDKADIQKKMDKVFADSRTTVAEAMKKHEKDNDGLQAELKKTDTQLKQMRASIEALSKQLETLKRDAPSMADVKAVEKRLASMEAKAR